jgi:voltage-gated potassium channel
VNQLAQAGHEVVLVDLNETRLRDYLAVRGLDLPFVVGDASEESVLKKAGIERATGLACALDSDQANLYTVLTARELNSRVRIVAKATGSAASKKFRLVGADSVVAPTELGGTRLFVEMTQPGAAAFLESLLLPSNLELTVREIAVSDESSLAGATLVDADLRRQVGNILILAIKPIGRDEFEYNPRPTSRIEAGASLMAMGALAEIEKLRALAVGNCNE